MENKFARHRRLRSSNAMRYLVRENHLRTEDLIYPIFVTEGENIKNEVVSKPGIFQVSLDRLVEEMKEVESLDIRAVMLFGVPSEKEEQGSGAFIENGIVQQATRLIKKEIQSFHDLADQ